MKRKAENHPQSIKAAFLKRPKNCLSEVQAQSRFRSGLFANDILQKYTDEYASSAPYRHSVITNLIDDALLRNVRREITENVSFTPKETDIYKIHQSGDLANLDGLDDSALAKLPSLLSLRDAIYSNSFRSYISHITACGPLSGRKTDMAINVYTPGCYLLCHDDVIGSRKVSYILYLTDPDKPWQPEWGGALRLYPVFDRKGEDGAVAKTPGPDFVKTIPPAWNQLSFFAVQPGESFHDVEEVYHADSKEDLAQNGGRIRMAVSGWFHIPQEDEDGYIEGAEEAQVKNSGLMQLQGNPDQHDEPRPQSVAVTEPKAFEDFEEADIEFLLKYLAPTYLTPDTLEQVQEHFDENSSIALPTILNKRFAATLKDYIINKEAENLPGATDQIERQTPWRVAKPPHKHRFLYMQPGQTSEVDSPIKELVNDLLPSPQFRAWLAVATNCDIESCSVLGRRFRRGLDYTLAMNHEGKPRLELNLGLTPTPGWEDEGEQEANATESSTKQKYKGEISAKEEEEEEEELQGVGGQEVYMAGDDEDDEDAAIYKSSADDDNILFFQAAAWNKLTIVMRDSGTLRFVKYISRKAKGDRWDISATYNIEEDENEDGNREGNGEDDGASNDAGVDEDFEEEFQGFSDDDADSD